MSLPKHYRPNVAIVVINDDGLLLACRRIDRKDAWQLPQGGIDDGEEAEMAMKRELEEEIGTNDVEIIGWLEETIRYDWPDDIAYKKGFRGQEQTYFLTKLKSTAQIDLNTHHKPEFDDFDWITTKEFIKRVQGFKAEVYHKALTLLIRNFPGTIVEE